MRFHATLLISSSLLLSTYALPEKCYFCTNKPDDPYWSRPYDPACGDRDYSGTFTTPTDRYFDRCQTTVWEDGHITRDTFIGDDYYDGSCVTEDGYYGPAVSCVCTTGDLTHLCNTGDYCEQCDFPFSTLHSTPATTALTTTAPATTTTTTAPPATTQSTATPEGTTTIPQSGYISCFSCFDCRGIDENTQVIQGPEVAACVTTLFFDSGIITRGVSSDLMVDGYCRQNAEGIESVSCWCTSSLCNNQEI